MSESKISDSEEFQQSSVSTNEFLQKYSSTIRNDSLNMPKCQTFSLKPRNLQECIGQERWQQDRTLFSLEKHLESIDEKLHKE